MEPVPVRCVPEKDDHVQKRRQEYTGPTGVHEAIPMKGAAKVSNVELIENKKKPFPRFFEVEGKTLADIFNQLNKRKEWGEGGGRLTYNWSGGGQVTVTLTVTYILVLPQWKDYKEASQKAQAEWDRMMKVLKDTHEAKHVSILKEGVNELKENILGEDIKDVGQMLQDQLDRNQARHDSYDQRTDHGGKEGVHLDTSIL